MDTVTGVGVLDKAMTLLRALRDGPVGLSSLVERTALPRATAHRLAVALEAHGLVRRDAIGRFDLGPELASLGRVAAERFPLVEIARPAVTALRDSTGESAQLFVRDGDARRCVLSLPSPHALRWFVPEGAMFPLDVGSAGRALRGEVGPRGWIESVEEREAGVASVSAPVGGAGGSPLAAVSVSGPLGRTSRRPGSRFGNEVAIAARAIERAVADSGTGQRRDTGAANATWSFSTDPAS